MFEEGEYFLFIVFVLLVRDRRICRRNSQGKRDTPTLSSRRISFFWTMGRSTGRMLLWRISMTGGLHALRW